MLTGPSGLLHAFLGSGLSRVGRLSFVLAEACVAGSSGIVVIVRFMMSNDDCEGFESNFVYIISVCEFQTPVMKTERFEH